MINSIVAKYLGIPYKHMGRNSEGMDCWGLILAIYKDLGYKLWDVDGDYNGSSEWEKKSLFIEHYHKEWEKVEVPKMFDVVLFRNVEGVATHAGIFINNFRFLHCCKKGVIVSRLGDKKWKPRLQGYYHFREMK